MTTPVSFLAEGFFTSLLGRRMCRGLGIGDDCAVDPSGAGGDVRRKAEGEGMTMASLPSSIRPGTAVVKPACRDGTN